MSGRNEKVKNLMIELKSSNQIKNLRKELRSTSINLNGSRNSGNSRKESTPFIINLSDFNRKILENELEIFMKNNLNLKKLKNKNKSLSSFKI